VRNLVLVCCLAVSCGPETVEPSVMGVYDLDPKTAQPLLLNDEITVIFTHALDPSSITRQSVRLVGGDGQPVEGSWRVDGRELEFSPRPVLSRQLDDGGYLPGEQLTLVLSGYPAPSAVRSPDGRWLKESVSVRYQVVDRESQGFLFYDATPNRPRHLEAPPNGPGFSQGRPLFPWEPLVLRCLEPIDPSSLRDEDFWVEPVDLEADVARVRLELLQNWDDDQVDAEHESRALLAVRFDRQLAPGTYQLVYVGRPGSLTDFRGNPVGRLLAYNKPKFRVGFEEEQSETTLDFVDEKDALPLVIEGSDGTAYWSDDGRVGVRYPAAAGHGHDGVVELAGAALAEHDLHATRITLGAGVEQRLPSSGLVVLRAQGRIVLDGKLVRRTGAPAPAMFEPLGDVLATPPRRTTLSEFLARAAGEDPTWTVVIAGGDLVVDGTLEIDTPLLLVAGGRVRGLGFIKPSGAARDQIWQLGEGGFDTTYQSPERGTPRPASTLVMDAPLINTLLEPLVYSVVSSPQPRRTLPETWIEHEAIGSQIWSRATPDGSHGEWRVHFAPRDLDVGDSVPRGRLVGSPWALSGDGACRVVIELVVLPAEPPKDAENPDGEPPAWDPPLAIDDTRLPPWDPPFVDRVRLVWSKR
jgi:hypothetical protein